MQHTDNGFTSCIINSITNVSNLGMAVHEMRHARERMTENHLQQHYRTAFSTAESDVARPPLIKSNRPVLTKCPSSGMNKYPLFLSGVHHTTYE